MTGTGSQVDSVKGEDGDMKIRELAAGERAEVSLPVQAYAFHASPADGQSSGAWQYEVSKTDLAKSCGQS